MNSPDLSDPDVRVLLDRNHVPEEFTFKAGMDTRASVSIVCEKCGEPYPCPTRLALRDRQKEQDKAVREALDRSKRNYWRSSNPHRTCEDPRPHEEHTYTGFARAYYCPGVEQQSSLDCGRREPHEQHLWTQQPHLWPRLCPGTSYEIIDCDDVSNTSHKAHVWTFRGADFWCPGG